MGIAVVDIWCEHVFLHRKCACLVFYTNKFNSLFKLFPTRNTRVVVVTNTRVLFLLVLILAFFESGINLPSFKSIFIMLYKQCILIRFSKKKNRSNKNVHKIVMKYGKYNLNSIFFKKMLVFTYTTLTVAEIFKSTIENLKHCVVQN